MGKEAIRAIFDHLKGKAKRDKDTGEGASNHPSKKKNKQWREGSLVAIADRKGVRSPPKVPWTTLRRCSKGHAFHVKHLYNDYGLMKRFLSGASNKGEHRKDPKLSVDDAEEKDSDFPMLDGCLMIFGGLVAYDSKHRQKLTCREVYMAEPAVPSFLRWLESAITFDWTDHSKSVP